MTATPDERLCRRRGGNCVCQQAAECIFETNKARMTSTWHRRRVWWFTELQNGQWVWPGTVVEYEQFKIDFAPYMLGSPHTVTHYRMAGSEVLKGPCATEAKLLNN